MKGVEPGMQSLKIAALSCYLVEVAKHLQHFVFINVASLDVAKIATTAETFP